MTYDDLVQNNVLGGSTYSGLTSTDHYISIPEILNVEQSNEEVVHTATNKEDVTVEAIIGTKTVKDVAMKGRKSAVKQLLKKEKTAVLNIPSPGTLSEIRNTKLVPDQGSVGRTDQSEEKIQTSIGRRPILKKLENNRKIKKISTPKSLSDISN